MTRQGCRENFNERWEIEQRTNPQPPDTKERAYLIYHCGWEDGYAKALLTQSQLIADDIVAADPDTQLDY